MDTLALQTNPNFDGMPSPSAHLHQHLLDQKVHILEMMAKNRSVVEILTSLAQVCEVLQPSSIAGIAILDRPGRRFERVIFPDLPQEFAAAIVGVPVAPPFVGSCAESIYEGRSVTSVDIRFDSRFDKHWREQCLAHGIQSIQSRPALAEDGTPLGAFIVGFHVPACVKRWDEDVMAWGASLSGLALHHQSALERYDLEIFELEHRIRNLLTVVGAISDLTLHGATGLDEARTVFKRRLGALARSSMLETDKVDLQNIVQQTLAPFRDSHEVEIAGPPIALSCGASSSLCLALHELATNAVKYGSLSLPTGRLQVTWDILPANAGQELFRMQWVESGGPLVRPPARNGFGREVIQRSLTRSIEAQVSNDFNPNGLLCTIEAPFTDKLGVAETGLVDCHGRALGDR